MAETIRPAGAGRVCPHGHLVDGGNLVVRRHGSVVRAVCRSCRDRIRRNNTDAHRRRVIDAYGGVCACCGETTDVYLCIDHVNDDGHADLTPSGHRRRGTTLYKAIADAGFPDTFQILCWNCNAAKSILGGCPDGGNHHRSEPK